MTPTLDSAFVRQQFPAFAAEAMRGQAFFESAGGSYMCRQVIDRYNRYFTERKVQPYYPFAASTLAGQEMDEARRRIAAMLGVESDELLFGPSTSQNTYVLTQAFRQMLSPGDAIIVTNQDHEANSGIWRTLADSGIEVREWSVEPETGALKIADLENLLDGKVRLVCFPHCSNIVAEINPAAEIVARVHAAGAVACVDGVSLAPHGWPNVGDMGADIYLFSAYKTWGPHQGIMVVRKALAERLPNQSHFFNADVPSKRLVPAGPDHAAVAACAGMVDYLETIHSHHFAGDAPAAQISADLRGLFAAHEQALLQPLLNYVTAKNSLTLLGPNEASRRAATVTLMANRPAQDLATDLAKHGVMAGGGHFYGRRLMEAMGHDAGHGALRISFVHYTTQAEIDQAITALEQIL